MNGDEHRIEIWYSYLLVLYLLASYISASAKAKSEWMNESVVAYEGLYGKESQLWSKGNIALHFSQEVKAPPKLENNPLS